LILRAVLTRANRVALNMTVPSLFRGIFMETRRWKGGGRGGKPVIRVDGAGRLEGAVRKGGLCPPQNLLLQKDVKPTQLPASS
jgi:hypothetical protein